MYTEWSGGFFFIISLNDRRERRKKYFFETKSLKNFFFKNEKLRISFFFFLSNYRFIPKYWDDEIYYPLWKRENRENIMRKWIVDFPKRTKYLDRTLSFHFLPTLRDLAHLQFSITFSNFAFSCMIQLKNKEWLIIFVKDYVPVNISVFTYIYACTAQLARIRFFPCLKRHN